MTVLNNVPVALVQIRKPENSRTTITSFGTPINWSAAQDHCSPLIDDRNEKAAPKGNGLWTPQNVADFNRLNAVV
jgi:hypothetical protein